MSLDREALRVRLRSLFLDELEQHVVILNRGLIALEKKVAGEATSELVNELFRSAHSLKGAAHAAAVEPVAMLCHGLEAALARRRDGHPETGSETLELLFEAVDLVAAAGRHLRETGDIADIADLSVSPLVRSLVDGPDSARREHRPPPVRSWSTVPAEVAARESAGEVEPPSVREPERPSPAAVRVPAARLQALLNRAGEVLLACEGMHIVAAASGSPGALAADRSLASAQQALTEAVRQAGMVPFAEACSGLDRVTRDVAAAAGKQARLAVRGDDVEIDRPILEGLREPLLHLVRNAVDHGIELPDIRADAGKEVAGTVTVEASLQGATVAVTVSDDGRGIDKGAVRAAAVRRGISPDADPDVDVLDLVFTPGLSTAPLVTDVSGRGVGLDAVRVGVEALGGSVAIESREGAATSVTIQVPVTRSVIRVVMVAAGREILAMPTSAIVRFVRAREADLRRTDDRTLLLLGDRLVPVAWLCDALEVDGKSSEGSSSLDGVVLDGPGGETVLVVDRLLAEREAVVKPPPARLSGLPGILGATILESGRVVLVVNPATAVRMATARPTHRLVTFAADGPLRSRRVLLVDDTMTTRSLERSILEAAGYEVVIAVDGVHALEVLEAQAQGDVDAVVSDVNMPRMDGLALCKAVRSSTRFPDVPVVLVTSLASEEDRRRGAEAGADAYIAKSEFEQSLLLNTLDRLL